MEHPKTKDTYNYLKRPSIGTAYRPRGWRLLGFADAVARLLGRGARLWSGLSQPWGPQQLQGDNTTINVNSITITITVSYRQPASSEGCCLLILLPHCYQIAASRIATRYACVSILSSKASTAADLRKQNAWLEMQTDRRVQRVRHDRGAEYMSHAQQEWYAEKCIEQELTAGYSPEANGLAERHNLMLLDMALTMLADSADASFGLPPLSTQHAADAIICANDLHNATPSAGAMVGGPPHEGLLKRAVALCVFRKFGCRVWNHSPSRPYAHRHKLSHRGVPGRFLSF